MDFLDPKKTRIHQIKLIIGYVLLGIAIILATRLLIYQAYGFSVKEGKVVQSGLVFVSSTPGSAAIYVDGQRRDVTNTSLSLQSGTYSLRLSREGYRDWQRAVTVEGGDLKRIDYPFLVPSNLEPRELASYATLPTLATQSPDRRWLLVQKPGKLLNFDVYDVKDAKKAPELTTEIALPDGVLSGAASQQTQTMEAVEWSNDNDHVLLKHVYDNKLEYIMLSRKTPAETVNLTQKLALQPSQILSLQDKKFDRYFIHDTAAARLSQASLDKPAAEKLLDDVLVYKSYGTNVVAYIAKQGAGDGKVAVKLWQDKQSYTIRTMAQDTAETPNYLLGLSRFDDKWFVTAGDGPENRVYVYENPLDSIRSQPDQPPVPVDVLKLNNPSYVAVSANSQMIMAESKREGGADFAVYDVDNDRSHVYQVDRPLDAPQEHAFWMDGNRLAMVSAGNALIFDYDGTNVQALVAASPSLPVFFDTGYTALYTLAPAKSGNGQAVLNATWLRTARDQ